MRINQSFPKYKEAVSIAGALSFFHQAIVEGKEVNFVGVGRTQKDVSKFLTLQASIANWKGTKFFAGGRPVFNPFALNQTLDCYVVSLSCKSFKAHCWQVINHPFYEEDYYHDRSGGVGISINISEDAQPQEETQPPPLLLNPCKRLRLNTLSRYHPCDLISQVQAEAVENNVDWCPNFNTEEAKKIEKWHCMH